MPNLSELIEQGYALPDVKPAPPGTWGIVTENCLYVCPLTAAALAVDRNCTIRGADYYGVEDDILDQAGLPRDVSYRVVYGPHVQRVLREAHVPIDEYPPSDAVAYEVFIAYENAPIDDAIIYLRDACKWAPASIIAWLKEVESYDNHGGDAEGRLGQDDDGGEPVGTPGGE